MAPTEATCSDANPRVVSLLSGLTEAVCAMGLRHLLVGRSHECDWPPDVLNLPQISQPRVDPEATAADIDMQVHESMQTSGTAYKLDLNELQRLQPNVLLVQDSCRVCAVSPGDLESCGIGSPDTAQAMGLSGNCRVVTVFPKCLEDVLGDFQSVADALGQPNKGVQLNAALRLRLKSIEESALGFAEVQERQYGPRPKPRVLVLEWCNPLMGCGYWIPELVTLAGGQCLFGGVGEHTEYIGISEISEADPDYIIFACCGFSVERSVTELCQLTLLTDPLWKSLSAVGANQVFISDGNRYFNRSGPSVVDTAEIIAQIMGLLPERKYGDDAVIPLRDAITHFGAVPREAPPQAKDDVADLGLDLEKAREVVQSTVEALQDGSQAGIETAYNHSAVSACMPLDLYKSSIIQNPDFMPLSKKALTAEYQKPQSMDISRAKIQVVMAGDCSATYVFRLTAVKAGSEHKWMIEGVSKIA